MKDRGTPAADDALCPLGTEQEASRAPPTHQELDFTA